MNPRRHGPGREGCGEHRLPLVEHAGGAPTTDALLRHLESCAPCRADLERAQQQVRALRELPRRAVPFALDGLTVAALQAGTRQERAVLALRALARAGAPADLDLRLGGSRAPAELDRLVAEELADPAQARVRRAFRRLPRLSAPTELEARLAASPTFVRRLLPIAAVLIGVLALGGALVVAEILRARSQLEERGPRLVVERVQRLDRLDPLAAQLLSGVSGGLPEARKLAGEEL